MAKRIWTRWFLSSAATLLLVGGAVFAFQVTVDPFEVWGVYTRPGFNNFKATQYETERIFKVYQYAEAKPDMVLFGSSRVNYCTRSTWPGVDDDKVFNYGINAAHIPEYYRYVKAALKTHEPKLMTLGVDFLQFSARFNEPREGFSQDRLDMVALSPVSGFLYKSMETVFSFDAVGKSLDTMRASLKMPDGQYFERGWDTRAKARRRGWYHYRRLLYGYTRGTYRKFKWSKSNARRFEKMMDMVDRTGIERRVYIHPISTDFLTAIDLNGKWKYFDRFKRMVVENGGAVYDFNYVNSVTANRRRWVDPSHFLPDIAERMKVIMDDGEIPAGSDFGVILTKDNIDEELKRQRRLYEEWRDANPVDVGLVRYALEERSRDRFYARAIRIIGR